MKFSFMSLITPEFIKRSITLKVVMYVGVAIISLVALQTYININQIEEKLNPIVLKQLTNALNRSNNIFNIIVKQTREDAQIIGSHNALSNYIDYEMLEDKDGMNEEVVNLEQFLRSLTNFKSHYQNIEISTQKSPIIHLENGEIAQETPFYQNRLQAIQAHTSLKKSNHIEHGYFTQKNNRILFTLGYLFEGDNAFISGDEAKVIISITSDITKDVLKLVESLQSDKIVLLLQSNNESIFNLPDHKNDPDFWLVESLTNTEVDLNLSVYKEKEYAILLITNMERASIFLAIGSILVISISLFLTSRFVIAKPLKSISSFISNEVLQANNLTNRYRTQSIDEIGIFSKGLNNMLDQIQNRENALRSSEERLALALWGGEEGMWELKFKNNVMYLDSGSCEILALGNKPIQERLSWFYSKVHKNDRIKIRHYIKAFATKNNDLFETEFRLFTSKQHYIWLQLKGKLNKKKNEPGITGTLRNITEEVRAEQEIQLYATAFNSSNNAITILDIDFKTIAVNKAFTRITGFSSEEASGTLPNFIQDNLDMFNTEEVEHQIVKQGYWQGEILGKRKNDDIYVKDIDLNPVYGKDKVLTHYVCVFSDITEKKKSEKELWTMANYDILTKLPNRGYFRETLNTAIANTSKVNSLIALLFIDLDKFKQVNDTLGHEIGDELLKKVGKILTENIRQNDTVARLGGDEFAIILEGVHSKENVNNIVEKIINEFIKGITVRGALTGVGASIGISFYPNDAKNAEELVHSADTAMYSAKTTGGNLYHFYHSTMSDHVNRRNQIEQELIIALKENSLCLYYQPQLDINTGNIVSFEALSRWSHPSLGFISPDEFIPIAEETGLIQELGMNVINQACKQLKLWHEDGHDDIKIAINISPKQFLLSDVHLDIAHAIETNEIDPSYLELELTESLIAEDPEKIISMLSTLKSLGVRLSIDDFGTGYSSLSYLSQFPLDILKIDKSFVQKSENDKRGLALTKAIVGIAKSLNLEVIAEGVETKEQLAILNDLGCEYMQGFYYSAAIPSEDVSVLLNNRINLYTQSIDKNACSG